MQKTVVVVVIVVVAFVMLPKDASAQTAPMDVQISSTVVGAATFVPAYAGAIIASAMSTEKGPTTWGFNACPSVMVFPFVGPFMAFGIADRPGVRAAFVIDGVAQLTGAGFFLVGVAFPKRDFTKGLMPFPIFSRDMTGFAVSGKF